MDFRPVTVHNQGEIKAYLYEFQQEICEYNINAMLLWSYVYHPQYAIEDNILYMIQRRGNNTFALRPFCESTRYEESFQQLYTEMMKSGDPFNMGFIDEEYAQFLKSNYDHQLEIDAHRDNYDYIHSAEELRFLKGKKYSKKRNHINKFKDSYVDRYKYRALKSHDLEECCQLLKQWRVHKDQEPYVHIQGEILGIRHLMAHLEELEVKAGGIYIDGQLKAFSIGSYQDQQHKMATIHVEKADAGIRGLYAYINQQFLIHGLDEAVEVNREEDMGVEGMRVAKMAYRPIRFVKKYEVREKAHHGDSVC